MMVHETLLLMYLLVVAEPPAPPPPPTPAARFEAGFVAGQTQYEAGAYLEAARTWVEAASRLPEVTANRENRDAIFGYIADAYMRGLPAKDRAVVLREAVDVLDGYCDGFRRAYGAETPINPKVLQVQYQPGQPRRDDADLCWYLASLEEEELTDVVHSITYITTSSTAALPWCSNYWRFPYLPSFPCPVLPSVVPGIGDGYGDARVARCASCAGCQVEPETST